MLDFKKMEMEKRAEIMQDEMAVLHIILNGYTGEERIFKYLESKYFVKLESDQDTDKLLEYLDKLLGEL